MKTFSLLLSVFLWSVCAYSNDPFDSYSRQRVTIAFLMDVLLISVWSAKPFLGRWFSPPPLDNISNPSVFYKTHNYPPKHYFSNICSRYGGLKACAHDSKVTFYRTPNPYPQEGDDKNNLVQTMQALSISMLSFNGKTVEIAFDANQKLPKLKLHTLYVVQPQPLSRDFGDIDKILGLLWLNTKSTNTLALIAQCAATIPKEETLFFCEGAENEQGFYIQRDTPESFLLTAYFEAPSAYLERKGDQLFLTHENESVIINLDSNHFYFPENRIIHCSGRGKDKKRSSTVSSDSRSNGKSSSRWKRWSSFKRKSSSSQSTGGSGGRDPNKPTNYEREPPCDYVEFLHAPSKKPGEKTKYTISSRTPIDINMHSKDGMHICTIISDGVMFVDREDSDIQTGRRSAPPGPPASLPPPTDTQVYMEIATLPTTTENEITETTPLLSEPQAEAISSTPASPETSQIDETSELERSVTALTKRFERIGSQTK